ELRPGANDREPGEGVNPRGRVFGVPQENMSDRVRERREAVRRLLAWLEAGGDREEFFRQLVSLYRSPLRGFFARRSLQPEDCEELIQETFLHVHCGLEALRSAQAFDGWIFAIALNDCRQW